MPSPSRIRLGCMLALCGLPFLAGCSSSTTGGNRPPIAEAGPDQVVLLNQTVTLDGRGSFDPDGALSADSYLWEIVATPAGGTPALATPNAAVTELKDLTVPGTVVVRLTVSDGFGDSEPDIVQIRIGGSPCTLDQDCQDGDACNGQEICRSNACQPGTALDCDDRQECTSDGCDPATGCTHHPSQQAQADLTSRYLGGVGRQRGGSERDGCGSGSNR